MEACTMETITKETRMEEVNTYGLTEISTSETGKTTQSTVKDSIYGLMVVCTTGNGLII